MRKGNALLAVFLLFITAGCGKKEPENAFIPLPLQVEIKDRCGNGVRGVNATLSLPIDYQQGISGTVLSGTTDEAGSYTFKSSPAKYALTLQFPSVITKVTIIGRENPLSITLMNSPTCSPDEISMPVQVTYSGNIQPPDRVIIGAVPGNFAEEISRYTDGATYYVKALSYPIDNQKINLIALGLSSGTTRFFGRQVVSPSEKLTSPVQLNVTSSFTGQADLAFYTTSEEYTNISFRSFLSLGGWVNPDLTLEDFSPSIFPGNTGDILQYSKAIANFPSHSLFNKDENALYTALAYAEFNPQDSYSRSSFIAWKLPLAKNGTPSLQDQIQIEFLRPPYVFNYENYTFTLSAPAETQTLIAHIYGDNLDWWIFEDDPDVNKFTIPYAPLKLTDSGSLTLDLYYMTAKLEKLLSILSIPRGDNDLLRMVLIYPELVRGCVLKGFKFSP